MLDWGREICGRLAVAESREWLCTNGLGGFASGTVSGLLTRRYHALLVAALKPPVGRTLLVPQVEEAVEYGGGVFALSACRWHDGTVSPEGYKLLERFSLDGTMPVWTYACADALIEKRIWMEQGANTTYVRYRLARGSGPVRLTLRTQVNYRDFHSTTHAGDWRMSVESIEHGLRVTAFDGARPILLLARDAETAPAHDWYRGYRLSREEERGLDAIEDHLHCGTFRMALEPGGATTLVVSAEPSPSLDGEAALKRQQDHEARALRRWRDANGAIVGAAPGWIGQLVLAADQFVVRRPIPDDPDGMSVIAGYPWFGDWGRDTMIALPGLTTVTGRSDVAKRILGTFARFVDQGMLPNVFPDAGEKPEYNTVDAALWYFEAVRTYHAVTADNATLERLFPVLESIIAGYRSGTRFGIGEDSRDGLIRAGEPGVQLTWMDAKIGDWVVTPRIGKPVEINALWFNALCSMAEFARLLGRPAEQWEALAERVRQSFERFWSEASGYCFDVIDGPDGDDAALRPNQIFAVSLPRSPLTAERQRGVVEACSRHLLTSFGLRSLAPGEPHYSGRYAGGPLERDGVYHQGTAWAWLLGPFALAHFKVHGDRQAALSYLEPMAHHLDDYGIGSIAEIFDGNPPFAPGGCPAQAWSVAETLRAWTELSASGGSKRSAAGRLRAARAEAPAAP
jgi:predicted glycogen debranching enzyme